MFNELFQSLHEAVKKRNTPDSYVVDSNDGRDVIHRGYIRNAPFPLRYDFLPDGKGSKNSGTHAYHFKDGNASGVVEISHRYNPRKSGHETHSRISFETLGGRRPSDKEVHRFVLTALKHHIRSHGPDIVEFSPDIPYVDASLKRMGDEFEAFERTSSDGPVTFAMRKQDPKINRILAHLEKRLNTNKEKSNGN